MICELNLKRPAQDNEGVLQLSEKQTASGSLYYSAQAQHNRAPEESEHQQ